MRLVSFQPDIAPNLGALIRLSACFGVPLDVIEPCGFPLSLKALRRSAMDYADIADITKWDSWEAYMASPRQGRLVLLTTQGTETLWDFAFNPSDSLVLGRESAGVPQTVADACDVHIRIPIRDVARSLNVTTAAAIALGDAQRQLR
ncbi:MAG: tRNA (cytidine(34)-2'-O)-methyltransferase [Pseudomonadota bacterium]